MSEQAKNELSMEQLEGIAGGVGPNVKALMTDLRTGVTPPQGLLNQTQLSGFITAVMHFGSTHDSVLQNDPKLNGLITQLKDAQQFSNNHPNADVGSYAGATALIHDVGQAMSFVHSNASGQPSTPTVPTIPGGWNRVLNTEDDNASLIT